MADKSSIEWTDATWNPIRGCSRVSEGCRHCYAEAVAARFSGPGQAYEGLAVMKDNGPHWTGDVRFVEEHLEDPLKWRRPRRIFVNSMSDLFHESLSDPAVLSIFSVMERAPQHLFQVLTKRPKNMLRVVSWIGRKFVDNGDRWPLPNVWLGVSVEDQKTADERIPLLLQTPATVRWISAEPLLGAVNLEATGPMFEKLNVLRPHQAAIDHGVYENRPGLDWIVVGGESGADARPFNLDWARSIICQCRDAKVPVFMKQLGARPYEHDCDEAECVDFWLKLRDRKGGDPSEWPEDLRVREYPS